MAFLSETSLAVCYHKLSHFSDFRTVSISSEDLHEICLAVGEEVNRST